ncbi:O-methyltransferase [Streptomyces niger]|uniref:O-methyltransferase n=1 Tax=Streptomyces niger TaxID=66373 RepID=UPI00069C1F05|nr:class I SAM-dependent methyltransferase [Streptomyces niger]
MKQLPEDSADRTAVRPAQADTESTATLLQQLVLATGATAVVACGPAAVRRAASVACALRDNGGGRVVACVSDADQALDASVMLETAGVARYVDVLHGDIRQALRRLPGPVDLLVLGCPGEEHLPIFRAVEPRLLPGALIVAMGSQARGDRSDGESLVRFLSHDDGYVSLSLPLEGGVEVAVRAL